MLRFILRSLALHTLVLHACAVKRRDPPYLAAAPHKAAKKRCVLDLDHDRVASSRASASTASAAEIGDGFISLRRRGKTGLALTVGTDFSGMETPILVLRRRLKA